MTRGEIQRDPASFHAKRKRINHCENDENVEEAKTHKVDVVVVVFHRGIHAAVDNIAEGKAAEDGANALAENKTRPDESLMKLSLESRISRR